MRNQHPIAIPRINVEDMAAKVLSDDEVAALESAGNKIMLKLAGRNWAGAHGEVEAYHHEVDLASTRNDLLDCSLAEIGVSVRTCNALDEYMNVLTVRGVLMQTVDKLSVVPNFGPKATIEVFQKITAAAVKRTRQLEEAART